MSADDTPPRLWWSASLHSRCGWGLIYSIHSGKFVVPAALPADAVELRPVALIDPSARIDVYVKALNVMDVGLRTEEIADGVNIDWWTDRNGNQCIAGVEVLAARSVTIDGQRVTPGPAVPDTAEPPYVPRRDDKVAVWVKRKRDDAHDRGYDNTAGVLDDLLDDYQLHADTGTPLDQHVCDGPHCCSDPAARSLSTDTEETS